MKVAHEEWFKSRVGSASKNAVAKASGLAQNSLGRQLDANALPAESVIKIAMAYGGRPVQALVDTGYLPVDALDERVEIINWGNMPDAVLLAELVRRCDSDGNMADHNWNRPLDSKTVAAIMVSAQIAEATEGDDIAEILPLRQAHEIPDDIAAHRPGYHAYEDADQ